MPRINMDSVTVKIEATAMNLFRIRDRQVSPRKYLRELNMQIISSFFDIAHDVTVFDADDPLMHGINRLPVGSSAISSVG